MGYNVKITNCNGNQMKAVKLARELTGWDLRKADICIRSVPTVFAENLDRTTAESIRSAFEEIGVSVDVVEIVEEVYASDVIMPTNHTVNNGYSPEPDNDKAMLENLWHEYYTYDAAVERITNDINGLRFQINKLEKDNKSTETMIERNERIVRTNGECLRPAAKKHSMLDLPDFEIIRGVFIGVSILGFIILLIMVAVCPGVIESMAKSMNMLDGLLVWLGGPAIGACICIIIYAIFIIKGICEGVSANKNSAAHRRNFNALAEKEKAVKFLADIDTYRDKIAKNNQEINGLKKQIENKELERYNLPKVVNRYPMPDELRNRQGILILLQYMNNGRAYTLKESINLYFQDLKDAAKMEELRKQTEYAQEQLVQTTIAAENTRLAYEEAKRGADAAERAARATEDSAHWNRVSAAANVATYHEVSKKLNH